jgi:hypothetical protein
MARRRTSAWVFLLAIPLAACDSSRVMHADAPGLSDDPAPSFDRSIDLSDATGPLPLDTPDDAARAAIGARLFYASALDTLVAAKSAHAKADTQNCPDGGTRTSDDGNTSRSERYDQCLDGFRYLDGFWSAEVTSPGYPWSDARAQLGENGVAFLAENRDPANDTRSLELGTLDGEIKIDFSGDLQEVKATANLLGAESDLDDDPRMNYGIDGDQLDVQVDGGDYLVTESGDFRLSGDCGVGKATVATPRALRVNKDTGAVTDGELGLSNGSGQTASVVFNADLSIDATAGAATQHYTLEAFRTLCPF